MTSRASNRTFSVRVIVAAATGAAVVATALIATAGGAQAATAVGLGTADSFAVLAGAGITNTGPTTITGDVGSSPTAPVLPYGGAVTILGGVDHSNDVVSQGAQTDRNTAFISAAGQAPDTVFGVPTDLSGMSLVPGVYQGASSLGLTGTVTLDAGGDPSAVFVFQAGSTLTTGAGSSVSLTNGAQACNVFWQIGSSATLGTNTAFVGTIIADISITLNTNATVNGRVLAGSGSVTMDSNTITRSQCATPGVVGPGGVVIVGIAPYAANIGPLAVGLVCPWGGQFDGFGVCSGLGFSALTNAAAATPTASSSTPSGSSPTATPTTGATSTSTAGASPSATRPTRPARPTTPASVRPSPGGGPAPSSSQPPQVPATPSGGIDTGR